MRMIPAPIALNDRRKRLGMSCAALAARSGVGLRTVQRVMAGREADPALSTLTKLAAALGVSLEFVGEDVQDLRRREAERKADQITSMVQGTLGLEAAAVSEEALVDLRARTIEELLTGPKRRLWGL